LKLVIIETHGEIADRIKEATYSPWTHIGVLINHNHYIDFDYEHHETKSLESLTDYYEILDDKRHNPDVLSRVKSDLEFAVYDLRAIIRLDQKLKTSRDHEDISSGKHHYTCSNVIAKAYTLYGEPRHQVYHWSQATPQDFYDMFGEK
jgi:hypothetical protein